MLEGTTSPARPVRESKQTQSEAITESDEMLVPLIAVMMLLGGSSPSEIAFRLFGSTPAIEAKKFRVDWLCLSAHE